MRYLLLMLPLLWACSQQNAGGPSSVETQNSIAGTLRMPDGSHAARVNLNVFRADAHVALFGKESQTNADGFFSIEVPDSGLYSVVMESDSGFTGRMLSRASTDPESPNITLSKSRTFQISLSPGSFGENAELRIRILGTAIDLPWQSSLPLSLTVPSNGDYVLEIQKGTELRTIPITVNADQNQIVLSPSPDEMFTLLDMEQSCRQNNLRLLLGESWNFVMDGNDSDNPSGTSRDMLESCTTDPVQGNVVHVSFQPSHEGSWVIFGTDLGIPDIGVNLSSLDSLTFWAKGSCDMSVGFITADILPFSDYLYAQTNFTLSNTWQRVSIPSSSLKFPEDSEAYRKQFTWENSSHQTLFLQWSTYQECEFWLDEVQLIGIQYSDLKIKP